MSQEQQSEEETEKPKILTVAHGYKVVTEYCESSEELCPVTTIYVETPGIDLMIRLFATTIEVITDYTDIIARNGARVANQRFVLRQGDERWHGHLYVRRGDVWNGRVSRIESVSFHFPSPGRYIHFANRFPEDQIFTQVFKLCTFLMDLHH